MKYKILSILFLTLLIFSCKDEFLDVKPIAQESEETFYTTMSGADMAITSCYSIFALEKIWDLSIVMAMGSIASDETEAGGRDRADVTEYQFVDQLIHTSSTANIFEQPYGYIYRTIGYCNIALEKLPLISEETDPAFNAATIQKRMGEAYFLRAFNFFTLTQIFGGVPVFNRALQPSEYKIARNTVGEVYNQVKADLIEAIKVLPTKSENGDEVGRASKGAAMALLAKVYLYESSYAKNYPGDSRFGTMNQHWDSVNYWAEQVITSGQYELVGINGERFPSWRDANGVGGYTHIFSPGANNSKEEVFSIQSRADGLGWLDARGTALIRWCAVRRINRRGTKIDSGSDYGWGWWIPSDLLVSSYEAGDPRYRATVLEDGDSIFAYTNGTAHWTTPNFTNLYNNTKLSRAQRKYECSPDEYWRISTTWKEGPTNVKMIRIADVYLMNAEAYLERGLNDQALTNINLVRQRARVSGNTGFPSDLAGTVTHEQLEHERLVELACEGHRYWDLVRWGIAGVRLNHFLADGTEVKFEVGKHEFFPLPQREITMSGGALKQYSNW